MFNANPLMRFDGYFALSDLLNVPNLYAHGRNYVFYLIRRYLLGDPISFDDESINSRRIVKIYGVLALFWRTAVITTLIIAANSMFYGAGVVMAATAFIAMIVIPIARNLQNLSQGRSRRETIAAYARALTLVGLFLGISFAISWRNDVIAPGVVDFADHQYLRARTAGFAREATVESGARVEKDDLIIRLDNPELEQRRRSLLTEVEQSKLRIRVHRNAKRLTSVAVEQSNLAQLERMLAAADDEFRNLEIRSPADGVLFAPDLRASENRYVQAGELVGELIESDTKELVISLDQDSMNAVELSTHSSVPIRFLNNNGEKISVNITRVDPR